MIRKIFIGILSCVFIYGCSSSSKNLVIHNELFISGGKSSHHKWDNKLIFKRISWYQELSMLFDVLYSKIDEDHAFYNWFSEFEKKEIAKCDHFMVVLNYSLSDDRLSYGMFTSEMAKLGYEFMAIPHFEDNLKMHPEYLNELLEYYKVQGACANNLKDKLLISFPGYTAQSL